MLLRTPLFFALSFLLVPSLFGQNTIGLPEISNYTKQAYSAGTQNWDIKQDKNGILYFANNEGLLTFDGVYWKIFPLPNKTNVRSIEIASDNRIYVGGQDEIGYFSPDKNGQLTYHSLKQLLPKNSRSFTDVWDIVCFKNSIFFRTNSHLFQLSDKSFSVFPAASEWRFLGKSNNQLFAQDFKNGLLTFNEGTWKPFLSNRLFNGDNNLVTAMVPMGTDTTIIATLKSGLYTLVGHQITKIGATSQSIFINERIYSASLITKEWIAIGTTQGGCYIINKQGAIIQRFSRREGLQNNNILSLFKDKSNNLWLGLDNGIDYIAYDHAIKHIYQGELHDGSGYTAMVYNSDLYVGTSNGLFKVPLYPQHDISFVKGNFAPIANTKGQVWNLSEVNGSLLLGHHEGAFEIKNNTAIPINTSAGFWAFLPFYNVLPSSLVIGGNYNGLGLFQYQNNSLTPVGNLKGFQESSRFLTIDNNNTVWTSHPYRGVYKIEINNQSAPGITLYNSQNGLPSNLNNHVYKIKNRIVVATEKGIYEYNVQKDAFAPSDYYKPIFNTSGIRYLKEDAAGNIWFIQDKRLGVVDVTGVKPITTYLPELQNKMVSGFEFIYPIDAANILVGAEKGFYHINYEKYKYQKKELPVHISLVKIIGENEQLLFGGYFGEVNEVNLQRMNTAPKLENTQNSFHFEFSSSLFGQQQNIEYSYFLRGFESQWSNWSKKAEKEYTNLPAGTYTFLVKARNNFGNESNAVPYTFTILPSWYQTYWAYFIYTCILLVAAYFLYQLQKKKFKDQKLLHEKEQKSLLYLHQLELDKTEKEIVKLKNEKLETEIEFKNRELATAAMHLVQKGEILTNIKTELTRLAKAGESEKAIKEFKKIIKVLNEEEKMDQDWEHFSHHFDKVHSDFLLLLKDQYPQLSANDLKLCAYLRMNLSSKEIAQLMNISIRGVEISRYRLRKKLQLQTEVNLFDFLIHFQAKSASVNSQQRSQVG